jgi:hypothetical protein
VIAATTGKKEICVKNKGCLLLLVRPSLNDSSLPFVLLDVCEPRHEMEWGRVADGYGAEPCASNRTLWSVENNQKPQPHLFPLRREKREKRTKSPNKAGIEREREKFKLGKETKLIYFLRDGMGIELTHRGESQMLALSAVTLDINLFISLAC